MSSESWAQIQTLIDEKQTKEALSLLKSLPKSTLREVFQEHVSAWMDAKKNSTLKLFIQAGIHPHTTYHQVHPHTKSELKNLFMGSLENGNFDLISFLLNHGCKIENVNFSPSLYLFLTPRHFSWEDYIANKTKESALLRVLSLNTLNLEALKDLSNQLLSIKPRDLPLNLQEICDHACLIAQSQFEELKLQSNLPRVKPSKEFSSKMRL